ncbi:E3 ubiquitin-protein ligase XIAP-like isoform X2 [Sinocyclocheilus anshuiensis]|uniref:E3 ubiquitin-protein ligase XIAP-like isoform X2 n=1 Tax=Sinocyclocheilus anshuiensis TaxID=1608454 RepID=UPI0007B8B566|nr:PREDICTED: E3 ubiquitin-protein ligase XIAP-like isoform X2 [Sinocyclocheilus anshuiensis]
MARSSQDGEIEADDAWSSMPNRVSSFQHFPRTEEFSAERLARAGFYFTGQADRVCCFSCHATVEDWNRGDAPLMRHQQASPSCKFLSCAHGLRASDLIRSPAYDEEAEAMEFQLRTGEVVDQTIYPNVPHMKSEEARLNTFSEWPADAPVQPEDLAAAGMYYLGPNDTVKCFCCGQQLAGWEPGDEAWGEHAKHYPNCFFILGHDVGNVPLTTPRPRVNGQRASLETFEGRLESFRGRQHPIDPERLARAGFYSSGEQDRVLCFKCGGGLKGWRPDEDPWEQHARHYPGCSFLLAEKGGEYVNSMQLRYPKGDHSRSSQNGFSSHEEAQNVLQSKIAQKAVDMGFDPIKVERTILQKLCQNTEGYASVEALIQDLSASIIPEKAEDPMTKLEKLQREKLCKVCMDSDINIVFIPCGHLVTCQKCSEPLNKCPICCAAIMQKIKIYNA